MIATGLSAPTQSGVGIAAATASPALSYAIGQEFKKHHAEGTSAHILSHAVLGAAVAAAGGNDALAGALSAGGAEYLAPKASVGWALAAHHLVSLCFYKNNPSENQNLQGLFQFTVRVGINAHPTLAYPVKP